MYLAVFGKFYIKYNFLNLDFKKINNIIKNRNEKKKTVYEQSFCFAVKLVKSSIKKEQIIINL